MRMPLWRRTAPNTPDRSDPGRPGPLTAALRAGRDHPGRDASLRRRLLWFVALWGGGVLALMVLAALMHGGLWLCGLSV